MILIKNDQTFPVDTKTLEQNTQKILDTLDYTDFDISIILVTPEEIQNYNKQYRDKDKVTDILSFPYHEIAAGERIVAKTEDDQNLGDIIICPQFVHDDLERWEIDFEQRMKVLLVHGICHLLGYDHIEDADYEMMRKQEAFLLSKINTK